MDNTYLAEKQVSSFSYLASSNIYSLSYTTIFKFVTQTIGKELNKYIEYKQHICSAFLVAINKYVSNLLSGIMV